MVVSDSFVYLWLAPVVLQIIVPLVILSCWTMAGVLKKGGKVFSKQNTLVAQPTQV